jgi:hypothetical protein
MRDLDQNFGPKRGITVALSPFFAPAISEAHIFQELEMHRLSANEKQTRFIDALLLSRDNWLPSALQQLRIFGNESN